MKMLIRTWLSAYISLLLIFVCSCKKDSSTAPDVDLPSPIYFNSFESSSDTVGWQGYGTYVFHADAPAEGGNQSLYVSGGCIAPHAWFDFQNRASSSYIKLNCWGKRIIGGGSASLRILSDPYKSIYCHIIDSVWTYYASPDSIFCASNDTLRLELISGGIILNSMLVDMIEVSEVK